MERWCANPRYSRWERQDRKRLLLLDESRLVLRGRCLVVVED